MKHIQLSYEQTLGFVSAEKNCRVRKQSKAANEALHSGTGKGKDFLAGLTCLHPFKKLTLQM